MILESQRAAIKSRPALFAATFYATSFFSLLVLLLISFWQRTAYFDDAWLAEQSYWVNKAGYVRSSMFNGFNDWNDHIYVFHKLHVYLGAAVMYVAGYSVMGCKLLNMLVGGVLVYLMWRYFRPSSREQQWLAVILLLGCGSFISFVSINRPEICCMFFGFSSYYCLQRTTSRSGALWGGIFAGLAALTHLNGLIYLAAGVIWLATFKRYQYVLFFSLAGACILSLYIADVLVNNNFALFYTQFTDDPATQNSFSLANKLSVMARYHEVFFHSPKEFSLVVLVLVGLSIHRKSNLWADPAIRYTGLLLITFLLLTKSNTDIYFLLFVPWFVIIATTYLTAPLPEQPVWQHRVINSLVIGYGIVALICLGAVINENRTVPYVQHYNAVLAQQMPQKHSNIIAPLSFFFGQMENYSIQSLTYYSFPILHKNLSLTEFFKQAEESGATYVVSDGYRHTSYDIPLDAPETVGNYRRIYRDKMTSIYERQQ